MLGLPVTQGSHSAFVNKATGRARIVEGGSTAARQRHRSWREAVRAEAQDAVEGDGRYPLTGAVVMRISFGLPKPQSAPKRKRTWPTKKRSGDIDKLERAVLDACDGVLYCDDAQVVELHARKDWATQPGAVIDIEEAADE